VVEGYYAAEAAYELSKCQGVDMPITAAAYQVLYEGRSAAEVVKELLSRQKKAEQEDAGWN
jgi:glycerol-3-phosphate dehydrogenase (NAD(P)+)